MILLEEIANGSNLPVWVAIVIAVISAIGAFWEKIKGIFSEKLKNKHELELKKTERYYKEFDELKQNFDTLKISHDKLVRADAQKAMILVMVVDILEKELPDNKTMVATIREQIKSSLKHDDIIEEA